MKKRTVKTIKKVALINPYPSYAEGTNQATVYPPMGLAYIAAVLEKQGVECTIIEASVLKLSDADIIAQIIKLKPDAIGITSNIVTAQAAITIGKLVRKRFPDTLLMYGGPYATAASDVVLKQTRADIVVYGEGEQTVVEIVKQEKHIADIKGIYYRQGQKIIQNPPRELLEDLDMIPFPAYHLLPNLRLYRSRSRKSPS